MAHNTLSIMNLLPTAPLEQRGTLYQLIAETIQATGGIPFSDFMHAALYTPKWGYYRAHSKKFGRNGDFVTAPEISPLFSYSLANQCADILATLKDGNILEFGAGSGRMALDLLTQLDKLGCLPAHYDIIEISPTLIARQQSLLQRQRPDLAERVCWLDRLPETFEGMILANEVLDAMPVERFKIIDGCIHQAFVCLDSKGSFYTDFVRTHHQGLETLQAHYQLAEGYESEYHGLMAPWLRTLSETLTRGVILLMDYGFPGHEYYHPERSSGTLMCHYRHHTHPDPFLHLGWQDITVHIDFTALACAASDFNLEVAGYTSQAHFLMACGLLNWLPSASDTDLQSWLESSQQIQKLTAPHEMGALFKVMALTKDFEHSVRGFQTQDERHRL